MKKILVAGAGGFIGGHLVKELSGKGFQVRAVDIKPLNEWYQLQESADNLVLDLRLRENCYRYEQFWKRIDRDISFLEKDTSIYYSQ